MPSKPFMVARMLLLVDLAEPQVRDGARAAARGREPGAGTSLSAGLTCAPVGAEQVATVDLGPLASGAQEDLMEDLKAIDCAPTVAADGMPRCRARPADGRSRA
ncbi:hypothetical protein [Streptomyces erythrochromogenes]|uniref:hypothetical protein n=1 Tax=Streptomyces erythrochromogenes TaxID=285574 RepID=UPI00369A3AD1